MRSASTTTITTTASTPISAATSTTSTYDLFPNTRHGRMAARNFAYWEDNCIPRFFSANATWNESVARGPGANIGNLTRLPRGVLWTMIVPQLDSESTVNLSKTCKLAAVRTADARLVARRQAYLTLARAHMYHCRRPCCTIKVVDNRLDWHQGICTEIGCHCTNTPCALMHMDLGDEAGPDLDQIERDIMFHGRSQEIQRELDAERWGPTSPAYSPVYSPNLPVYNRPTSPLPGAGNSSPTQMAVVIDVDALDASTAEADDDWVEWMKGGGTEE